VNTRRIFPLLRWLLIVAGPAIAVGCLCRSYGRLYDDGLHFVKGLHAMGFLMELPGLAVNSVLAALVSLAALIGPRRARRGAPRVAAAIATSFCLLCGLGAYFVIDGAFERGRHRAYCALDGEAIVRACRQLRAERAATTQPAESGTIYLEPTGADADTLPEVLRTLEPIAVIIGVRAAGVWIDGGGPGAHEGLFVPLEPPDAEWEQRLRSTFPVVSEDPLVFRFNVADCRALPYE